MTVSTPDPSERDDFRSREDVGSNDGSMYSSLVNQTTFFGGGAPIDKRHPEESGRSVYSS